MSITSNVSSITFGNGITVSGSPTWNNGITNNNTFGTTNIPVGTVWIDETARYLRGAPMPTVQARTQTLIDGYVGQILVNGDIVWQSPPKRTEAKALAVAVRRITRRTAEQYS